MSVLQLVQESGEPQWNELSARLRQHPSEASQVDPSTNFTVLHHAIINRSVPCSPDYLSFLKHLLKLHPEATLVRCHERGYTPLAYAVSSVGSPDADEDQGAEVVKLLLDSNKGSLEIFDRDGLSQLDIHIKAVSRLVFTSTTGLVAQQQSTTTPPVSSTILELLAAQSDQKQLEAALETLYACNTLTVMERYAKEEARAHENIRHFGRQTRASDKVDAFWVWEWVLILLEAIHNRIHSTEKITAPPPFHALHVASQITDCPPPFLLLAMRVSPSEVRTADRNQHNLPLHQVASWQIEKGGSLCRKSMTLTSVLHEYPAAMDEKNNAGKTPMDLETESKSII